MRHGGDDGIDEDEFGEGEEEAGDVFGEEDVSEAGGAEEVELDAGAVYSESVVGEDGDAEDGVGDGDGEEVFAVASAGAETAGEEKDHEERRDESVKLVDVAADVDEFFLEAGDDGGVEAEGVCWSGCGGGDWDGARGSTGCWLVWLLCFALVF